MPRDDLTFGQLCEHLEVSAVTARKLVRALGLRPRRVGPVSFYTAEQAEACRRHHAAHGGRWPPRRAGAR